MKRSFFLGALMLGAILSMPWLLGCPEKNKESDKTAESQTDGSFLMRVGETVAYVDDFQTLFEIAKVAYPYEGQAEKVLHQKLRLQVMNQLKVEMLLRERARELNLSVSDADLDQKIAEIKADFPEQEFEKLLLTQAIEYKTWAARLRTRLLMEKVIGHDLGCDIPLTPEAIRAEEVEKPADPTKQADHDGDTNSSSDEQKTDYDRQETENAYGRWIQMLEDRYPVQINQDQWKRIYGSILTAGKKTLS